MPATLKDNPGSCSADSLKFFKKYQQCFGQVVWAKMKSNNRKGHNFILRNADGEEMYLSGCLSGYPGEGPKTTLAILQICEFDITYEFIVTKKEFEITRFSTV